MYHVSIQDIDELVINVPYYPSEDSDSVFVK